MTYWEDKGKYQDLRDNISRFIPHTGKCNHPELELYRLAANVYYDVYNNGGCNQSRFVELLNYLDSTRLPFDIPKDFKKWLIQASDNQEDYISYMVKFDGSKSEKHILKLLEEFADSVILYVANSDLFKSGDLEFDPEPDIPKDYPFKNYNHLDPEYEGIDRI